MLQIWKLCFLSQLALRAAPTYEDFVAALSVDECDPQEETFYKGMQRDLNIYLPAMEKQLNILDTLYEVHGLESDEVVWPTARPHLKNSGTVSVDKNFFHFGFGTLFLFIVSFQVGRVLSVLGERYVWFLSFHYACVAFKCRGTVSLWIITVHDECFWLFLFWLCTSSSLHLINVTEQNLAFAAIPEEKSAHAADFLGYQHGTQAGAAASDSPTPCHDVGE